MLRDNQLKPKEKLTVYDEGSFLPPCKGYCSINDLITLFITSAGRRVKTETGKEVCFTNIHVLRTVQKHRGRSLTDESLQYRSPPRTSPLGCGWPQGVASDGRAPVMVNTSLICCQG